MQARVEGFRLSPQQKLLWLSHHHSSAYFTQCAILLEGDLKTGVLEEALQKVVARHEILRTTFHRLPGMKVPVQVVSHRNTSLWRNVDLSGLDASHQETQIEELFRAAGRRPFDFEQGPLFHSTLLTLSADKHLLLLSLPALCADAWTLKNLVREIGHFYASSQGDGLFDEPIRYIQFSEWQNALLERDDAEIGRSYWRRQTAAALPALKLPFERVPAGGTSFEPEWLAVALEPEVVARIEAVARQHETAAAAFLLACWQTLLWRLTGQGDILLGRLCDGRGHEMLHSAAGLFAKWLPVKTHFEAHYSFGEVLRRVAEAIGEGEEWQEYFHWEESLGVAADPAAAPIGFEFVDWPAREQAAGLSFSVCQQSSFIQRFRLQLSCARMDSALRLTLHYDPACFAREEIERLMRYLQTLVGSAARQPEASVSELEVLARRDREQLLVEFNQTSADYPQEQCIHQLFEQQVERTPQQVAVVCAGRQLSYQELNAQANQLAHYLRQLGVGAGVRVGLCVDRSVEMLIGLLGILKAGGAYVPLNPEYPKARLAQQLQEIEAPVVLTQEARLDRLPESAGELLCLDRDQGRWSAQPATNPAPVTSPEQPVYVIYTSGSTGVPKGVVIRHRSLVNYTHYICQRLGLTEEASQGGLQFATVSTITADLGNTCIYPSLVSGGCLHILSYEVATDGRRFAAYVAEHPIDVLKIVPSHLGALLASQPAGASILPRKYLILGGEALSLELVKRIREQAPGCEVINHYGPTETTVGVLTARVSEDGARPWESATVPIGRPIANTEIYILDQLQQPVPLGVAGELYIGGVGLAAGYLKQPERTAERFVKHPYARDGAGQLYRTGDLVRYLPNGEVEFLGRVDNQVKVRGYRIELEEIEVVLGSHPGVRQAVVVAREEEGGHKRLVAYVVPNREMALSINDLHHYLSDELPEYMLPSAYVLLEALPLTPNGKVDRKALPAPDHARLDQGGGYVAPRNPTEELLAGIWAKVLGLERVGVHDNFFALGGHSLLAMKLIARVRETFRVELPLRDLFEAPTVAWLAEEIAKARMTTPELEVPPILPIPRDQELPLSFSQQRLWFLDQLVPESSFYNVPAHIRLKGSLNVAVLERAITEIIKRHEVLRTVYQTVEGRPIQVISSSISFTLPIVDLRGLPEDERETEAYRLAAEESQRPFNLAQGPLFRVALLQLGNEDHVLLSTTHHIISDIWSRGVLTREVAALYDAFAALRPSPLPDLPVQYADFAHWQRQWLQGEVLEEQLSYWGQQLAGSPTVLELPADRPRPAVQSFCGADLAMALPQELSQAIVDLSRREGVTLFMTLLAAFQTLLFRYTGQESINVGSPIAGRTRPETEGMIGFFLNTLVFRTDFSDDPSFRELLRQVREVSLGAFAHQDLPFEQLVEALQPERNMSHSPLFQVAFVMLNTSTEALELPGLKMQPFRVEDSTAKYDLTLFVVESQAGLTANLEYSTDLFDASTIRRMLQHLAMLLESIVADPNQRVSALALMSEPEAQQLLVEWNQTETDYPLEQCLHHHIEAQVERAPEAVALVFEGAQLTYGELNRRANQLAYYLQRLGVGPEVPVGICLERSLEMIVGILGVLKAGGAYLPLDPAYPLERLAFMLEDSQAPVLLTQQRLIEGIGETIRNPQSAIRNPVVVCLDTIRETLARERDENLTSGVTSDHPAYVIYTSGSTGKPKGVVVSHRAICNHMLWQQDHLSVTAADCLLQKTAFSFDASGTEFYLPLFNGGRLILPRPGGQQDSSYLVKAMIEHQVTILQLVPSLLRVLLEEEDFARCESLSRVICAGEALPAELQERFNLSLAAELHNFYGPTEAAIDVTCWSYQHADGRQIVPIGRPLGNTQVYVLDSARRPVPVGVPGELYIGGANLARGYLNRPELTAERFTPHPFSQEPGARLYKTGDLARYLPDGHLEFLGRIDHQVKVRGFRIELGEIEAALGHHPAVQEAVVLVREDVPGDKRLVAYLVADQELSPSEWRGFLKGRLPEYMVPAAFVRLKSVPLTPNGKVDRRALPAPDRARPELERAYVAPRTPIEEKLSEIVAQLLRIERVGIEDNFFELGGHSLLATQFMSRLRNAFQVELPLRSIFEGPTVAELAGAVEKAKEGGIERRMPAMKPIPRETRRVSPSALSKIS